MKRRSKFLQNITGRPVLGFKLLEGKLMNSRVFHTNTFIYKVAQI
jgi:hypothetical protein